jgi:hypothetical protein
MGTVAYSMAQEASKSRTKRSENKKRGGPGLPASLEFSRFREKPASLTEGGQPCVGLRMKPRSAEKSFMQALKKFSRIVWKSAADR